ncbi:hypothetical protein QJS10_CPA08g00296 [Acorus calamus]|uniref:Uncharacterized protein n=1 Tax=Acorus calamus TaxID=4465 RepID=A0AAV9EG30_ACOCL|nr:hypothetical protein QJS10_CPA08g00296 [Acorus calamus]
MATGDQKNTNVVSFDRLSVLEVAPSKVSRSRHQLLGLHHQIVQLNSRTSFSKERENDAARSWTIQSMLRTTI